MNPPDPDTELEAWLRRSSSIHEQLARLDRSDPPEELDRIVLDHAREAIRAPRDVAPFRQMRWAVPVALAATLLLSFAILLHVDPAAIPAQQESVATQEPVARQQSVAQQESIAADPGGSRAEEQAQVTTAASEYAAPRARERAPQETPAPAVAAAPAAAKPRVDAVADRALSAKGSREAEGASNLAPDIRADPDRWLAAIGQLRAQGLEAEAEREWAEFRRVYPERGAAAASAPLEER